MSATDLVALLILAACAAAAGYAYALYPLLLGLLVLVRRQTDREAPRAPGRARRRPHTHLFVSVFNEERTLPEKLANTEALLSRHPHRRITAWFVSDASTDDSDRLVRRAARRRTSIRLFRARERSGKNVALNRAVEALKPHPEDVLVFSDANSIYEPDAIEELERALADGAGFAVGSVRYREGRTGVARGEGLYWKYENAIKNLESRLGRMIVANGAIFAVRARHYRSLSPYSGNDLLLPLFTIADGGYGVMADRAVAWENAGERGRDEFGRHRRIVNRSLEGIRLCLRELDAFTIFQLASHKMLRWIMFPLQIAAFGANALLAFSVNAGPVFGGLFMLQCAFYGTAALGAILERRGARGAAVVVHALNMLNIAALAGIWDHVRGRRRAHWNTIRAESAAV